MARLTAAGKLGSLVIFLAIAGGGFFYAKSHGMLDKSTQGQESAQSYSATSAPAYQTPSQPPVQAQPVPQVKPATDTYSSILQNHVVRVSVENPSKPIYWDDGNGNAQGFNVDFLKLLMQQPEFSKNGPVQIDMVHHEVSTYEDVPKQLLLTDGNVPAVDIAMDGLTYSDNQPVQGVQYSNAYVTDFGYSLIVPQASNIHNMQDLIGKRVGILKGDSDVRAFVQRTIPGATFVEVSDQDAAFLNKALDNNVVDAFVYDYPFAVPFVNGSDLKFAITKLDGSDLQYKIGMRSSDTMLQLVLNSAIGRAMNSPQYADLLRKYFASNQIQTTAAHSGERTYTVKKGDSLGLIAEQTLGNRMAYTKIQRRNNLPNPNLIMPGQVLVIPS
jgi:ABC-type amino acid transport substrate-binding protein